MLARPIPQTWLRTVLAILEEGERDRIEWPFDTEFDWQQFGLEQDAYTLIIKTLTTSPVIGASVVGMRDRRDGSYTDCWCFLCPNPLGTPVPLYCKIGIHHSKLHINLFSLHPDDGREKLFKAIAAYHKTKKK